MVDTFYEQRGQLLLEKFALQADLRRVESLSARRALEIRCAEIDTTIHAIDEYIDRLHVLQARRAARPAPVLRIVPAPSPIPRQVQPARSPQKAKKPPKPKPEPTPVVAAEDEKPVHRRKEWKFTLDSDAHLPVRVVPLTDVRAGAMASLGDEIDRRAGAMLSWAPWSRRRRHSRRYEGFQYANASR